MLRDDTHAARMELVHDKEYQSNKKRAEQLKRQQEEINDDKKRSR